MSLGLVTLPVEVTASTISPSSALDYFETQLITSANVNLIAVGRLLHPVQYQAEGQLTASQLPPLSARTPHSHYN